jgi:hypothetical protein
MISSVDALFLYKEEESQYVERIVNVLISHGYRTFFWKTDVEPGQLLENGEMEHLKVAGKVIVCLGRLGWGVNHLRLVEAAREMNKEILPVLIGEAPGEEFLKAGSLFRYYKYIDMSAINESTLKSLITALGPPASNDGGMAKFDLLINRLVDGNEEQRDDVLYRIRNLDQPARSQLAERLRIEIVEKFSPGRENEFASAVRDPKKMSSVRSWMLSTLIWCNAEESVNKKLILLHLNAKYEPEETVRYWVLAGLYQAKVTYLEEAAHLIDDKPGSITIWMAEAILDSKSKNLLEHFTHKLVSGELYERWKILRILRVVPILDLAKLVCEVLRETPPEQHIAYDAFYALTTRQMAEAAVPFLKEKFSVQELVARLIAVVAGSNITTVRRLSHILLVLPDIDVDHALNEARKNPASRETANSIRLVIKEYRTNKATNFVKIAGYSSDTINTENDWIDIKDDVKTLTAVMLAKDIKPPLAIGLFGKWGSGKSFFMDSVKAEVKAVEKVYKVNPLSPFHTDTVQITFNAWHYNDTNLWASLVHSIFKSLAGHVIPQTTEKALETEIKNKLNAEEKKLETILLKKETTAEEIEAKERELKELEKARLERVVALREIKLEDLNELVSDEDKKKISESLAEIGLPETEKSANELQNIIEDANTTSGTISNLFLSIVNSKNRWLFFILLAVTIVGVPLLFLLIKHFVNGSAATITSFLAGLTVLLGSLATTLKRGLDKVKKGIKTIEETKRHIDKVIDRKRKQESNAETTLKAEITTLKVEKDAKVQEFDQTVLAITTIKGELTKFYEARSLSTFLTQRIRSDEYLQHLGLITTIREDFKLLQEKLDAQNMSKDLAYNEVGRIILYIDDLDRCPPNKVMEVLQAVHLLLAYPLFVVVVGVDPRWLVSSLEATMVNLDKNKGGIHDSDLMPATPQDFMEKIFQIPFGLRPMTETGFSAMINGLLTPEISTGNIIPDAQMPSSPSLQPKTGETPVEKVTSGQQYSAKERNAETSSESRSDQRTTFDSATTAQPQTNTEDEYEIIEESMRIKEWETRFATELFHFISSPRAIKRFSNIYRLLKTGVIAEQLTAFEGSAEMPGNFQMPMLLLAVLIGYPQESVALFSAFHFNADKGKKLSDLFDPKVQGKLISDVPEDLKDHVRIVAENRWFPNDPEAVKFWIPKVARFSYDFLKIDRAISMERIF